MKTKNMDGIVPKPNITFARSTVIGCDVDGTLINFDNTPNYQMIDILRNLKSLGCQIVISSGGGKDYAKHWIDKLGLEEELEAVVVEKKKNDKIDIFFDDEMVDIGRINIKITPNNRLSL